MENFCEKSIRYSNTFCNFTPQFKTTTSSEILVERNQGSSEYRFLSHLRKQRSGKGGPNFLTLIWNVSRL